MKPARARQPPPPLDAPSLERIALSYAGRYATTRAKLRAYLGRKVKQRGWNGQGEPPIERLVERFSEAGYVDDRAFAAARAASLGRRGYGPRRVSTALRAAGIGEEDGEEARDAAAAAAWDSALRFAERKRLGPFAGGETSREDRQKALAAMMRAGHSIDHARRIVNAPPGVIPEWDGG